MQLEIDRLNKQKCGYCSGWGHSGNDCPTDKKLLHLRLGVREQATIITQMRKECRADAGMKNVRGFSRLPAKPKKAGRKRRHGELVTTGSESDSDLYPA